MESGWRRIAVNTSKVRIESATVDGGFRLLTFEWIEDSDVDRRDGWGPVKKLPFTCLRVAHCSRLELANS